MPFKRYKSGDKSISASDLNARADSLERVQAMLGPFPGAGLVGMSGWAGVLGMSTPGPMLTIGKLTYRSASSGALASTVNYKAESLDGSIRITTAQTPLFRMFSSGTRIIPAAENSECLLGWFIDSVEGKWTERILMVQEVWDPGAC
ncbi:MAG: hypothetical protein JSS51_04400 [Planctomycetes bacterium]|nr:hypothetical protein [Planctomycetota bacterium]